MDHLIKYQFKSFMPKMVSFPKEGGERTPRIGCKADYQVVIRKASSQPWAQMCLVSHSIVLTNSINYSRVSVRDCGRRETKIETYELPGTTQYNEPICSLTLTLCKQSLASSIGCLEYFFPELNKLLHSNNHKLIGQNQIHLELRV